MELDSVLLHGTLSYDARLSEKIKASRRIGSLLQYDLTEKGPSGKMSDLMGGSMEEHPMMEDPHEYR